MSPQELAARFATAASYHRALANADQVSWRQRLEQFRAGDLGIAEALVLVHPRWYADLERDDTPTSVRGRRQFSVTHRRGDCQSSLCWGYRCPHRYDRLQVDHYFPYALGGPTEASNSLWLCETHNAGKGADIHVVPLDQAVSGWLELVVDRIERLFERERRRGAQP